MTLHFKEAIGPLVKKKEGNIDCWPGEAFGRRNKLAGIYFCCVGLLLFFEVVGDVKLCR